MLWYKSWLETRWRFLIGLGVLICSAVALVFAYPKVLQLMPLVPTLDLHGELGERIKESAALARDYRGYVWSQWFRQNLPQTWTLFAAILGTGGIVSQTSAGSALFTLSLPVSRERLLAIRAATGLIELFVLALIPSLVIPLVSPAIGQGYSVGAALVHSACLFVAGAVFFSLAALLSTVFNDVWRPLLIVVGIAVVVATVESLARASGLFSLMSAEPFFRAGAVPWSGLAVSGAASAALLYTATRSLAHKDF